MKVITLDKTKELLGITDTSLDDQINRYIPIIDAKVKQITNNRYNMQIVGDTTIGEEDIVISGIKNVTGGIQNYWTLDNIGDYIIIGSLLGGENIEIETYVEEFRYTINETITDHLEYNLPVITMSEPATATASGSILYLGIDIGLQPTIAKGIAWLIGQENQDSPELGWTSQRIGSVSVVRGVAQAAIDGRYGLPVWFVNAFPKYMSVH